jgi:cysteine-rich repeat protein
MKTKLLATYAALFFGLLLASTPAHAFPSLNLTPGTPDIQSSFINVAYVGNNAGGVLTASGFANVLTPPGSPGGNITGGTFDINANINFNAQTASGSLVIGGTIAGLGFNSGTLLTGVFNSTAGSQTFGAGPGDPLEFLFTVTGGDAAALYGGVSSTAGVILSQSGYIGSFASNFTSAPFGALADTFGLVTGKVCGDSLPNAGEQCDDGNTVPGDGCDATCQVEAGSDCTAATPGIPPTPSMCYVGVCGDSIASDGEACDDGNTTGGDGCSAVCSIEDGWECTAATPALDFPTLPIPSVCTVLVVDSDGDGVPDSSDNCPLIFNTDQADNDSDGTGDVCDGDDDNDNVDDADDNCPINANADQADNDSDDIGDVCDPDDDNDNVADGNDNCPLDANPDQANFDGDSEGDVCDVDDDNDNVVDTADLCPSTVIPEGVPTNRLLKLRYALVDGDGTFDTTATGGRRGPGRSYTIGDTAGCSCEQIIPQLLDPDDHQGHLLFGCSISLMDEWVELVNP